MKTIIKQLKNNVRSCEHTMDAVRRREYSAEDEHRREIALRINTKLIIDLTRMVTQLERLDKLLGPYCDLLISSGWCGNNPDATETKIAQAYAAIASLEVPSVLLGNPPSATITDAK